MADTHGYGAAVRTLAERGEAARQRGIKALFEGAPQRFDAFSAALDDLTLDYSKTALSADDREALFAFARECGLEERRDAMFAGARINATEGLSLIHI